MNAHDIFQYGGGRGALAVIVLVVCTVIPPATACGDEASPRRREWVEIPTAAPDSVLRALVVYPQVEKPAHVVIILHEDHGLTSWERGLADQFAAAGYIAIAPDLLSDAAAKGSGTDSFETTAAAREAIYNLKSDRIEADLDAVFEHAQKLPTGDKRVALAGFGWGASQAFLYASHNPDLAAILVFYGAAPSPSRMKQIQPPVYGFYGETDLRVTGEVSKVKGQMHAAGRNFQAVTYPSAGHGFLRAGEARDASPADRKAREESWTRIKGILESL